MSDHTRADEGEGREPGQIAYEAWVEREWEFCQLVPWLRLSDQAKADWAHIEQKSAAQAEAEVARLTAALAEAERERDEGKAMLLSIAAVVEPPLEDGIWSGTFLEAVEASEASVSALRERVATLEAALQPFANYAADMPGADFGEGEIGEYYHDGFRRSICTQDLRAARTALEATHADN